MVYRNNAGRRVSGSISVFLETRWLGQKSGFYVPDQYCITLLQEQVAATMLHPRNMPDLNCIPANKHDQAAGWALLRGMVIAVIDEVKSSDASTDVNDSIKNVNDFLVTASAAAAVNSLAGDLSSAEIADKEIKIWQTRTVPFPKDKNPLDE